MDSPLLTFVFMCSGVLISFFALTVESQGNVNPVPQLPDLWPPPPQSVPSPPQSSPPPLSHPSVPPPSLLSTPPPFGMPLAPPPQLSTPPPSDLTTLSPPPPPPPPPPSPPPSTQPPPPPPPLRPLGPPPSSRRTAPPPHREESLDLWGQHGNGKMSSPPKLKGKEIQKLNLGKKIGLLFVGIAVILQAGTVTFLVIKRRQLLRNSDKY